MTGKFEQLNVDRPLHKPQSPQANSLPAFQRGPGEPGYVADQLDGHLPLDAPRAAGAPAPAIVSPGRRMSDHSPIFV